METAIDWNDTIKKEARGVDDTDLGEVQNTSDNYVIVQKGIIEKDIFIIPKDKVESFDGQILRIKLSEDDIKEHHLDSVAPSVREQYLSTINIDNGGGSSGGIHIEKND